MFKRFKFLITGLFIVMLFSYSTSSLIAQGMSRSNGIGFRTGFWKTARSTSLIKISGTRVEVSGAGAWMYFFSRFQHDWSFELNLGAVGSVITDVGGEDVTAILPFLFGLRWDYLAMRTASAFQPYFSFGLGPYWITSVDNSIFEGENVESGLKPGAYLGTGVNIELTSWFALNFDLKYHFVDFKFGQDLSGYEFGVGFSLMWGRRREIIRIKDIKVIITDIYPAYYQFYNLYPIAIVTIQNMTKSSVEVNVRSNIRSFSDRPKNSGYIRIAGKETRDIPITAIFSSRVRKVATRESAVLDLIIEARAGNTFREEFSSQIMIHNRNSWNGEMDKLVFFVIPDDERILKLSRQLVKTIEMDSENILRNFNTAKHFFNEFEKMNLRYQSDPNIPFYQDDRVQYAIETLELKTGDCDDLVVLYASLLESVGINTAFVEVRDPEKEIAHVYLIFNSGIPATRGELISSNEKRYLTRENSIGQKTIWLPIETTLIGGGFEEAWKAGALQYLQEGVLRKGVVDGWVRMIDVE